MNHWVLTMVTIMIQGVHVHVMPIRYHQTFETYKACVDMAEHDLASLSITRPAQTVMIPGPDGYPRPAGDEVRVQHSYTCKDALAK